MFWCRGSRQPDTYWSWVVCISATLCNLIQFGFMQSFAVFLPVLSEHFKESRERTAWAGSIALALNLFVGPFAVKLTNRFGHRIVTMGAGLVSVVSLITSSFANHIIILYFSYGMLFGLSGGTILNIGFTITTKYFRKKRALATGITVSGISLGVMILGPVLEELVEVLHWRNTFRVMAGVMLLICILSSTYDPIRVEGGQEQQKRGCSSVIDFTVFRNASYTIGVVTITASYFGIFVPFIHLVRFAKDVDISSKDASLLFIYIGICSTISRIVIGQVIDKKWLTALQCVQLCSFTMGMSIVLSAFAKEYSHFVMFAVAFGITNGGFVTAQGVFLQTILQPEKSAIGLGMGYMVFSVAVCAGPPFAGFLADKLGSYIISFYVIGGIVALSATFPFILLCSRWKKKEKDERPERVKIILDENNENDVLYMSSV